MTMNPDHYLKPRTRWLKFYWLAPLSLCALACALAVLASQSAKRASRLDESNRLLMSARKVAVVPKPQPAALEEQRRWAELKVERGFPWSVVFDAVEQADRPNIELLEFRPDKRNRRVILRGEALDHESLSAYLEALTAQPAFRQVHVLHLQSISHDKLATVGFEIKANIN